MFYACENECVWTVMLPLIGEDRREDIRLVCSKMQFVCSVAFKCISDHKFNVGYVFWRVLDMPLACFDLFRM